MKFTKTHEWFSVENNIAKIGISAFAADELGDIVYVSMPSVGDEIEIGDEFAEIESVKAVSPICSPVSGTVVAVNEDVDADPALINSDAEATWLVEVEVSEVDADAMDAEEYQASL